MFACKSDEKENMQMMLLVDVLQTAKVEAAFHKIKGQITKDIFELCKRWILNVQIL